MNTKGKTNYHTDCFLGAVSVKITNSCGLLGLSERVTGGREVEAARTGNSRVPLTPQRSQLLSFALLPHTHLSVVQAARPHSEFSLSDKEKACMDEASLPSTFLARNTSLCFSPHSDPDPQAHPTCKILTYAQNRILWLTCSS